MQTPSGVPVRLSVLAVKSQRSLTRQLQTFSHLRLLEGLRRRPCCRRLSRILSSDRCLHTTGLSTC